MNVPRACPVIRILRVRTRVLSIVVFRGIMPRRVVKRHVPQELTRTVQPERIVMLIRTVRRPVRSFAEQALRMRHRRVTSHVPRVVQRTAPLVCLVLLTRRVLLPLPTKQCHHRPHRTYRVIPSFAERRSSKLPLSVLTHVLQG